MKNQFSLLKSLSILALTYLIHSGANSQELTPADIYAKVSPAILEFSMYDIDSSLSSCGTAVAIGDSGLIYTNIHIYTNGMRMELKSERIVISDIKIVGIDTDKDILVLKIPAGIIKGVLTANSDSLMIGQSVYALGNPMGYVKSLSLGLISGIRTNEYKLIQFTAGISHGSSGGALLNSKGELLGITSLSYDKAQNLNFAVPINYYLDVQIVNENDSNEVNFITDVANSYSDKSLQYYNDFTVRLCAINENKITNRNLIFAAANILEKAGMREKALLVSSHGVDLYPEDKVLLRQRAGLYLSNGKSENAIIDLTHAIEIDSNYAQAILDRAWCYSFFSETTYASAKRDYLKYVSLCKGNEYLLVSVAELCVLMGDTSGAFRNLYNSYFSTMNDEMLSYRRGKVFSDLGDYKSAASEYSKAITYNPGYISYYGLRGMAYIKDGDYGHAYSDYLALSTLDSRNKNVHDNLGYIYFNLELYDKAIESFSRALKLDSMYVDAYLGLAISYFKLNRMKFCFNAMSNALHYKKELKKGFTGLESLKADGFFWNQKETISIKKVYKLMGIDEDILPGFGENIDDNSVGKANTVVKRGLTK